MEPVRPSAAEAPVPPPQPAGADAPAPAGDDAGIVDNARALLDEGGDVARAALDTLAALKTLAGAELALAKAAVTRAAVFLVVAAIAGLVATFYLFATLAAALVAAGLGWPLALGIATLLLLLGAGLLVWRALAMFRLARFDGTRRQLARLREESR